MAFKATIPDFSGLFDPLNEAINTYKERKAVSETLGDLDTSSVKSLEEGASRLAKIGRLDQSLKLQSAAQALRAQRHRESEDIAARGNISQVLRALSGGGGGRAEAPAAPAAPALPGQNLLPWPGPQSAASTQGPQLAEALLGATGAQAQGGPVLPEWAQQGISQPGIGRAPPGVPAAQQAPALPLARDTARAEIDRLQAAIGGLGTKGASSPVGQMLLARLRNELSRTNLPAPVQEYEYDRAQRRGMGLPDITLEQYQDRKELGRERFKEVQEVYKTITEKGEGARNALTTLERMETILKNPDFVSGRLSGAYGMALSGANTLIDIAKSMGIDPGPRMQQLINDRVVNPSQLQDEFRALSNRVVTETLKGLGNQISNADREYMSQAFPSLMLTPEGNMALIRHMREVLKGATETEKDAREYRRKHGTQVNREDMDEFLAQRREGRRLFVEADGITPTAAGKKLAEDVNRFGQPRQVPVPPPAAAPAAPAQGIIPPVPPGGPPTLRDIRQGIGAARAQTGASPPARLSAPAGAIVKDGQGRRYRIGPDGTPIPLGPEISD